MGEDAQNIIVYFNFQMNNILPFPPYSQFLTLINIDKNYQSPALHESSMPNFTQHNFLASILSPTTSTPMDVGQMAHAPSPAEQGDHPAWWTWAPVTGQEGKGKNKGKGFSGAQHKKDHRRARARGICPL